MQRKTIPSAPHEWQCNVNALLGANLVGDVCGKKTTRQAHRWARNPGMEGSQNGPLAHVMLVNEKLVEEGSTDAKGAALDSARLLVAQLNRMGVPCRIAIDLPANSFMSASLASHSVLRAASNVVDAAVSNRPPILVNAHIEFAMQQLVLLQRQYAQEFKESETTGEPIRFSIPLPKGSVTDRRAAKAAKGGGYWKAIFKAIWKRIRGK